MSMSVYVWDPFVRLFHWGTATLFVLNYAVLEEDGRAHVILGYVVLGLVLARIVWGLVGTRHARFSAFMPYPSDVARHLGDISAGRPDRSLSHNPLGALMVYNLLAALLLIGATGVMLRSDAFWGIAWVETAHELLVDYTVICVGLHIAGVLFETRHSQVNLIKAMITGYKDFFGDDLERRDRGHGSGLHSADTDRP